MALLEIRDLHASVEGKSILRGVSLKIRSGEIHSLMGPNGSGKSTLAYVLMGHPKYSVDSGEILLDGESVLKMKPEERAKKGLFLSFQYPLEIPGVSMSNFLRSAYNELHNEKRLSVFEFQKFMKERMSSLGIPSEFSERFVNDGFSGGEKKRSEIMQMSILGPKIAVLDETDSGLDIDALKSVAEGANKLIGENKMGALLITHYQRILKYVKPQFVHVMVHGKIVRSGGPELAEELEATGYSSLLLKGA